MVTFYLLNSYNVMELLFVSSGYLPVLFQPTVDPYLVLHSSTPQNATLGEMVIIRYTVAARDETLRHTLNGSQIPNPVASASNAQLHEYSFTASSSERGQYMLMLSKFSSELYVGHSPFSGTMITFTRKKTSFKTIVEVKQRLSIVLVHL